MSHNRTFLFDEACEAKRVYETGFPDGILDYSKLYLVAKYLRDVFGYGEIRLEKELIRFCQQSNPDFNPVLEADMLKKWVASAMRYSLRQVTSVQVSLKEIDFLKGIPNSKDRKLLFTILVFSKALKQGSTKRDKSNLRTSDKYYLHYNNFGDILRLSELKSLNDTDIANLIYTYSDYFYLYNPDRELVRLEFVDIASGDRITISNLDNLMEYYRILFEAPQEQAQCERCGAPIAKNSNSQKYCKVCAKIVEREQHKFLMREIRASKKEKARDEIGRVYL